MNQSLRKIRFLFAMCAAVISSAAIAASPLQFNDQAISYEDCSGKPAIAHVPLFNDDFGMAGPAINHHLYVIFLRAAPPDALNGGTLIMTKDTFFNGQIEKLNARVKHIFGGKMVEVALDWRECGSIVDTAEWTYRFDARSGRSVDIGELLTPAGQIAVADRLQQGWRRRIVGRLAYLDRQLARTNTTADRARFQAGKDLYEQCMDERFGERDARGHVDPLWIAALDAHGVTFKAPACASHIDAALDELGDFSGRLSIAALYPYLTGTGRYFFFNEKTGAAANK